jgi:type II secretory ATPase GspE/PulE/Tfp pilus assembly ATPase PilB-like protein
MDKEKGTLVAAVKSENGARAKELSSWIHKHLVLADPAYWPSKIEFDFRQVLNKRITLERLSRQKVDHAILARFPAFVGEEYKVVPLAFYPDESDKRKGLVVLATTAAAYKAAKEQEIWIQEMVGMEEVSPRWPVRLSLEYVIVPDEVVTGRLSKLRQEVRRGRVEEEPEQPKLPPPPSPQSAAERDSASPYTDDQLRKRAGEPSVQPNEWLPIIDLKTLDVDPNLKQLVWIFRQAVECGASDVHLNTKRLPNGETIVRVRMRRDGLMQSVLDSREHPLEFKGDAGRAVIRILGHNAGRTVTPVDLHMYPQDGKAVLITQSGERMDVRLAFAPVATVHQGVDAVARLLASDKPIAFKDLSLSEKHENIVQRQLKQSSGIYIWTGPTGEGKTTSLRALLGEVDKPDINMITVDDPVEYSVPNASQREVHADSPAMNWTALSIPPFFKHTLLKR